MFYYCIYYKWNGYKELVAWLKKIKCKKKQSARIKKLISTRKFKKFKITTTVSVLYTFDDKLNKII